MAHFFREAFKVAEQEERELKEFRQEMADIAVEENTALAERRKGARGHFQDIETSKGEALEGLKRELNVQDMIIWKKIKDGTVTGEEFSSYQNQFFRKTTNKNREAILSWIVNRAFIVIGRRDLERWREKRQ